MRQLLVLQQWFVAATIVLLGCHVQAAFLSTTTRSTTATPRSHVSWVSTRSVVRFPPLLLSSSGDSGEDFASPATTKTTTIAEKEDSDTPTVFTTGFSTNSNLMEALREAIQMAMPGLFPSATNNQGQIVVDLALVSISSLYDGSGMSMNQPSSNMIVPTLVELAKTAGVQIRNLMGSSVAGCISSTPTSTTSSSSTSCQPVEYEGVPAVSITLCQLPGTVVQTFHVSDVPDDVGRLPVSEWNRMLGLKWPPQFSSSATTEAATTTTAENNTAAPPPTFWLLPSPAFATQVDDLLYGLTVYHPGSTVVGGIASTVSSLSRAKLYQYSLASGAATYTDGCVGVAFTGDLQIQSMTAQGAKPVGGIYRILKGQDSTVSVIVLDETATDALQEGNEDDDDDDDDEDEEEDEELDAKARAAQLYAKARIPKPPLAEANFLMRTLSDDDQSFMRRQLLIGLEVTGSGNNLAAPRSATELVRLASGQGHRFTIQQVASAGMKDGSVMLPLGRVHVTTGTRLRFFVRESEFAKKEVEALWLGYKKRLLNEQFSSSRDDGSTLPRKNQFAPAACWVIPTLDRGAKFFLGKQGFESAAAARMMPGVPCVSGFFANAVIAPENSSDEISGRTGVQGSASGYFLLGSRSRRPIYTPAMAAVEKERLAQEKADQKAQDQVMAAEDARRMARAEDMASGLKSSRAPRSEDGELVLKRREVHSGRALTVSTVEWSVAERTAKPSSALEGYMWDKETEVDRFRERVPLANLVSQCRLSASQPNSPKPRDYVGPIKEAAKAGKFVIIPECKRTEPVSGSLRRRYDISKLARELTLAGVPALSVNCDGVLFGGSIEDITKARETSSAAAVEQMSEDGVVVPPILASDLLLYPYQLYKLSLAGADAVTLLVGALASKDLTYLSKIASSLQFQVLATVTSPFQIQTLTKTLPAGSIDALIVSNRDLEDFGFDMTGEQALSLLKSEALAEFRAKNGNDIPVLVEGRVGIIERDSSTSKYVQELKEAGALGAIVGGGLAKDETRQIATLQSLQDV